jgi:hypothetical protein
MLTTTNMSLKVWNTLADTFSHTDLQANWNAVDAHDHTTGKGLQIPAGGLAANAVTTAALANGAVTATKIADALKPSTGAAAGVEALRAIGSGAGQVVAGNDSRLTDRRVPSIPFVTALPGSPTDGQTCVFVSSDQAWLLQYRSAEPSAYKWHVLGGPSIRVEATGTFTTNGLALTWGALSTPLNIVAPLAGTYTSVVGVTSLAATSGTVIQDCAFTARPTSETVPTTPPLGCAYVAWRTTNDTSDKDAIIGRRPITVTAASQSVNFWSRTSAATTWNIINPWMEIIPTKVG